jgi:flagella basal body P-ring formation protein FlgA
VGALAPRAALHPGGHALVDLGAAAGAGVRAGWAAQQALPAGSVLQPGQLIRTVVEWSAEPSPVQAQAEAPLGRALQRPLQAGEALRLAHLKPRQWFAAGDTVRLQAQGLGFAIRAEGQAMAPGLEGQTSRVRLDSGRTVQVWPLAERQAEVLL